MVISFKIMLMVINMKETGIMVSRMEKANILGLPVTYMTGSGKIIK